MITASRWFPPLRYASCPSALSAEEIEQLRQALVEMGADRVVSFPAGCRIEIASSGQPRTFRPRTALGLTRAPELRPSTMWQCDPRLF